MNTTRENLNFYLCLVWPVTVLRSNDWLVHSSLFCNMVWLTVHSYCELLSSQLCSVWLNPSIKHSFLHAKINLIFCLMALDFMIQCHWVSVPVFHVFLLFSVIWPFCSQLQMIWTLQWTLCTGSRCWMLWRGFPSPLTNHPPLPYKSRPYSCC